MKEEYRTNKLLVKKQARDIEQLKTDVEDAKLDAGMGGGFAEGMAACAVRALTRSAEELEETKKELTDGKKKIKSLETQVKRLTSENQRLQKDARYASLSGWCRCGDFALSSVVGEEEVDDLKKEVEGLEKRNSELENELDEARWVVFVVVLLASHVLRRAAKDGSKSVSELDREKKKRETLEKKIVSLQVELDAAEVALVLFGWCFVC